jgi:hypothetical protein
MCPGRTENKWWAWVDLNHRPRPYQSSTVRFYNDLQDRGDCQNTRKSYETSHAVGWVVGWKKSRNSAQSAFSFLETLPAARFILRRGLENLQPVVTLS